LILRKRRKKVPTRFKQRGAQWELKERENCGIAAPERDTRNRRLARTSRAANIWRDPMGGLGN